MTEYLLCKACRAQKRGNLPDTILLSVPSINLGEKVRGEKACVMQKDIKLFSVAEGFKFWEC